MTELVTGASGFLGSALVRELVRRGARVRILARRSSNLLDLADLPIEVTLGCLEEAKSLRDAVKGVTRIYHCAGLSTDWAPWDAFRTANVLGVRNLLEAVSASDSLERLLHVSTTDVYGYPTVACPEEHPIVDVGLPYNRSKGLGETSVRRCAAETGLPITIVRPANIYGPRDPNFVLEFANLLRKRQMLLVDGGRARAGLLYIDNAVTGILDAAISSCTQGRTYNLRDGSDVTWRSFADALADGLGVPRALLSIPEWLALRVGGVMERAYRAVKSRHRPVLTRHAVLLLSRDQGYPVDRARSDFGFRSAIDLAAGIQASVDWLHAVEA